VKSHVVLELYVMSMTHLTCILIGLYSISVEGKEFVWWHKSKPLEVLSIIATVRSQILKVQTGIKWKLHFNSIKY